MPQRLKRSQARRGRRGRHREAAQRTASRTANPPDRHWGGTAVLSSDHTLPRQPSGEGTPLVAFLGQESTPPTGKASPLKGVTLSEQLETSPHQPLRQQPTSNLQAEGKRTDWQTHPSEQPSHGVPSANTGATAGPPGRLTGGGAVSYPLIDLHGFLYDNRDSQSATQRRMKTLKVYLTTNISFENSS